LTSEKYGYVDDEVFLDGQFTERDEPSAVPEYQSYGYSISQCFATFSEGNNIPKKSIQSDRAKKIIENTILLKELKTTFRSRSWAGLVAASST